MIDLVLCGCVFVLYMVVIMGLMLVGVFIVGWVVDMFGFCVVIMFGGMVGFIVCVIGVIWVVILGCLCCDENCCFLLIFDEM